MTLTEFLLLTTAYSDRQEDEWERTAHIMSAVMNFSGMGLKEPIAANEIFSLRKHQEDVLKPITSWEEARELIDIM